MRNFLSKFLAVVIYSSSLFAATGTPSNLTVRTDANGYLVVTAVTQTNPITAGVFTSRVLKTDASGNLQVILAGTVTPTYPMAIPASTCAAPSLGLSGGTTTGIAFTATPSILECISGTARTTLTASSWTSTVPLLGPNGAVGSPAFSFTSDTDVGMYFISSNNGALAAGNAIALQWDNNGTTHIYVNSVVFDLANVDVSISRIATNTLGLGVNNKFTFQATGLTTTSTDGIIGINNTAALVGQTVQISPRIRLTGTGWDADDSVSRTVSFFEENLPATANTVTGTWKLGFIDPAGTTTYPMVISSTGALTTLNNIVTGGAVTLSSSNDIVRSTANGLVNFNNNNESFGVQINNGTAAPTLTTCGTGAVTSGSRNSAGEGTATGATVCTVTFGTPAWTNTPFCTVVNGTAARALFITAASTTAFTVNGLTAADKFTWTCIGRI